MWTWRTRTIAIIIVLVLFFSAALVGTYAWDSDQRATNSIFGKAAVKVPVVLVKEEKLADGTMTGKALPDTAFYLFSEDGTQIGAQYRTDENGEIHVELNAGSYYFEEEAPAVGYTYDKDEHGGTITRYPFQVCEEDQEVLVQAYNVPLTGSLLIRKTVENSDGSALSEFQKKVSFAFVVTFSDGKSYDYQIDGHAAGTLKSGGTLQLAHGQTACFPELPVGLLYNVTEQTLDGYTVSSTGHRGNITEAQSIAAFINRADSKKMGSLTISKTVEGGGANLSRPFQFTVTIGNIEETFSLKHGESKKISGLPLGATYKVVEADASADGYFASVQSYSGQIVSSESVKLPFVNVYDPAPGKETGSLTVTKEVRGFGKDPNLAFPFTIVFTGPNAPQDETFTLRDGESKTFWDIPLGTSFTVTEADQLPKDYYANVKSYTGCVAAETNISLPFVNAYDPVPSKEAGSLTVRKTLTEGSEDQGKLYEFVVTFPVSEVVESQTFTLKAGETQTIYGIPHGTIYTVAEIPAEGDTAIVHVANGVVTGGDNVRVDMINTIPTQTPEATKGNLVIRKAVTGYPQDPDKMFTFSLEFSGKGAPANEKIILKAGMHYSWDIPEGVTYRVTETDAAGYQAVFETASGTIIGGTTADITFTNVVPNDEPPADLAKIRITKQVAGDAADLNKEFSITFTAGSLTKTFSLKHDETQEFTVPAGTVYEVREADYYAEGYSQSVQNGYGTASGTITATIKNTYQEAPTVEISGVKNWDMAGYKDVELPKSITVQLIKDGLLVEEQTVIPDKYGQWAYTFTALKYNGDGTEAHYEVKEVKVSGYETSYDGFNITNTYIPPVTINVPVVLKMVEGEDAPDAGFYFVLKGKPDYPMPEGSEGYTCLAATVGAGQVSFGSLAFNEPGEYTYTIYEERGEEVGWDYDTAVYTVIFTVTDTEEGLSCTYRIEQNDKEVDAIVFTNHYTYIDLSETTVVSGQKIWNHGANPASAYPHQIVVKVYGDGSLVLEQVVTAEDGWTYSFELPKYTARGKIISYTVDEAAVEHYSKTIDGYDIINTYVDDAPYGPDNPQQPGTSGGQNDIPHTGDDANLPLWITLMVVSAIGLLLTLLVGRKPRYKGKYLNRRQNQRR